MAFDEASTPVSSPNSTASSNQQDQLDSRDTTSIGTHDSDDNSIVCECGRRLGPGWTCPTCRRNCSICQRALIADESSYCDRCYSECEIHGLYRNTNFPDETPCPQCRDSSTTPQPRSTESI
ncbi:hypothetical protein INT43_001220 [Umbelopsis isabellina]|uniref:Uncharacterized protein n=1 Tax=Mortierella isabellina TaxID=91625 RepID=A0A8H7PKK1_MORIS|nr:hypothetical protein INT43_001220 [Umbelopsis isabellina]